MGVYKRGGIWWTRFMWKGEEIRKSAGTANRDEALDFERKIKDDLKRIGRGGHSRKTYREGMEFFVEHYLPELAATSQVRYLTSARALHEHFENVYLDEINKTKLNEFIRYRKKAGVKAAGINRDLACLSSMLTRAADQEMIEANPMRGIPRLRQKEPIGRVRFLKPAEFKTLCKVSSLPHRRMIIFAVETGLRFEEQFSLTWEKVDMDRKEISLVHTKNGEPRIVPLEPRAVDVLKALTHHKTANWVFWHDDGERYRTLRESFGTAIKNAKITDFTWHDLRHTFASWKAQAGMDMYRLQQLLGHKRPEMTQRYAHLRTDDLKAELKRVRTPEPDDKADKEELPAESD